MAHLGHSLDGVAGVAAEIVVAIVVLEGDAVVDPGDAVVDPVIVVGPTVLVTATTVVAVVLVVIFVSALVETCPFTGIEHRHHDSDNLNCASIGSHSIQ